VPVPIHVRKTTRPATGAGGWHAVFVFAPLLILAALGIWGLRESRVAAKRHAVQAIEATVPIIEQLARDEEAGVRVEPVPFNSFAEPWPVPRGAGEGAMLYEQALAAEPGEADRLLDEIDLGHENETTASGLPLLPLAHWTRLQLAQTVPDSERAAERLAVAAVRTHPSALSSELLLRAETLLADRGGDTTSLAAWRVVRAEHEHALALMAAESPNFSDKWEGGWLPRSAPEWFFSPAGNGFMRACSPARLRASAGHLAARVQELLPAYFALDVVGGIKGRSLLASPPVGERFFERSAGDGIFTIAWVLTDPAKLYAEQMQQALWLGALLIAALLTATAGFFALRRSLSRERQLSEMKSNFVSSVSHELRAPLASMRLMAENLEGGIVTEEPRRAEYHRLLADECRRLAALVDNVLDFARIEQGRKTYHFAETDVASLVADTLRLLAPVTDRRGQKFASDVQPVTPRCDGLAIQQALVNLLDNALKFSPAHSTITVRVAPRGALKWELSVSDEGPGVAPHEREKIFERFYRVGSELTREATGAGIGLSIVKHIVEGHGGYVEVQGAKFTLVLPLAPEEPHRETAAGRDSAHRS
jgi:signal transduction histidine kinase